MEFPLLNASHLEKASSNELVCLLQCSFSCGGLNITGHVRVQLVARCCWIYKFDYAQREAMISQSYFFYHKKISKYLLKLVKLIATCGLQNVQCVQSKYEMFGYIIST